MQSRSTTCGNRPRIKCKDTRGFEGCAQQVHPEFFDPCRCQQRHEMQSTHQEGQGEVAHLEQEVARFSWLDTGKLAEAKGQVHRAAISPVGKVEEESRTIDRNSTMMAEKTNQDEGSDIEVIENDNFLGQLGAPNWEDPTMEPQDEDSEKEEKDETDEEMEVPNALRPFGQRPSKQQKVKK